MIHLAAARQRLSPQQRLGLTVLVDASGLLPTAESDGVISLELGDTGPVALESVPRFPGARGVIQISPQVLEQTGALAAAIEEQASAAEDRHGRVPSTINPMVRAGRHQVPWINAAGHALRTAVLQRALADGRAVRTIAPWPAGHRWAAAFTHDLDVVRLWPLFAGLRFLELSRKGRLGQAMRVVGGAAGALAGDPVGRGVEEILQVEKDLGITSTWFIISGHPTLRSTLRGDITYPVEHSRARRLIAAIAAGGHEIGLHGSFATMRDAVRMKEERDRLGQVSGAPVRGGRQHFLRMRPGTTQRVMAEAGLEYDATFGFPDRNGFRLGCADVLPWWDAESASAISLEIAPLTWMDRALSKYAGVEQPAAWVDEGLRLAEICRGYEGLWVGLWHPNLVGPLGFPGAPEEYRRLATEVCRENPFLASLAVITDWRRARRSVVAQALTAGGSPVLSATIASKFPLVLEDGRGAVMETQPWPVTP